MEMAALVVAQLILQPQQGYCQVYPLTLRQSKLSQEEEEELVEPPHLIGQIMHIMAVLEEAHLVLEETDLVQIV